MGAIEHLTISLSAQAAEKLRARVQSGDYQIAAILPDVGDGLPDWFRAEVVMACDELDRDPSQAIPIEQVRGRLRADRIVRGE